MSKSLEIRVEPNDVGVEYRTVTFIEPGGDEVAFLMPVRLAGMLKTRVETMELFRHGLKLDGKLVAMFRKAEDRDYCHDILEDVWPVWHWEAVSC